jgi:hypothetical protein
MREEVTGAWRKNWIMRSFITLNASPDFIRVIKSTRIRWVRNVVRMGETRREYKI